MTAKEYLQQAFRLNERINADIAELERLREFSTAIPSMNFTQDRIASGSNHDRMGKTISKIVDLEVEINAEVDRYVNLHTEIRGRIELVEDDVLRLMLKKRYLNFERWEKIAVDLNKDIRWVFRLHGKALKIFSNKYGFDH